jgi:hypothetical protein
MAKNKDNKKSKVKVKTPKASEMPMKDMPKGMPRKMPKH